MKKLLFLFLVILNSNNTFSCSCSWKKISQKEYDKYSLAFIGKIVEVEKCDNKGYQKFTFEIEEIFKGQATQFVSGFNNCGGVCNNLFKSGQKMLIYSNPEYGLINDQYACNPSILIATEENGELIGKEDYIKVEDWKSEIDFLQSRKTKEVKIVSFQFIKIVPFLKQVFLLSFITLIFLFLIKKRLILLYYSIGSGIISGIIYFLIISSTYTYLEPYPYRIHCTLSIFLLIFILNFIFSTRLKSNLNFGKSFLFSFITYTTLIISVVYLIILNEHQKQDFDSSFYKILLAVLVYGLIISLLISLFFELKNRIKRKRAAYNKELR